MTVVLGGMSEAQRQSWVGLLEVAATLPDGWCLVGGQMVHLYCQERSFAPARPPAPIVPLREVARDGA